MPSGPMPNRDGERRVAHLQVHAFSPQTDGHLCGDLFHRTSASAGFHQQPAKLQLLPPQLVDLGTLPRYPGELLSKRSNFPAKSRAR